jgi:hypothetical protein
VHSLLALMLAGVACTCKKCAGAAQGYPGCSLRPRRLAASTILGQYGVSLLSLLSLSLSLSRSLALSLSLSLSLSLALSLCFEAAAKVPADPYPTLPVEDATTNNNPWTTAMRGLSPKRSIWARLRQSNKRFQDVPNGKCKGFERTISQEHTQSFQKTTAAM